MAERRQPAGQAPFQGRQGQAGLGAPPGGHQAGHRLGLGEVQLAVEPGATGELAGMGQAAAQAQRQLHHPLEHGGGAVGLELDQVLAGVGSRRPEEGRQGLVQEAPVSLHQVAEMEKARPGSPGAEGPPGDEKGPAGGEGPGTADPDDPDAAWPRRGGRGHDGGGGEGRGWFHRLAPGVGRAGADPKPRRVRGTQPCGPRGATTIFLSSPRPRLMVLMPAS